jgi:methionyl aminopeptidase
MTKTPAEIALMAEAGRRLAQVFTHLDGLPLEGMSTLEINDRVEAFIVDELKARPASKGQYGYGFALNSSRNAVVCHGVPSADEVLKDGDIVNLDITLEKDGFIADSSKTYLIGSVGPQARRLVRTTYEALLKGIRAVRPGARLGDIGFAIERHAKAAGYSVVRDYCGHGIGREMHEEPQVLHFGRAGTGLPLKEGMVFTIEPMLNQGVRTVRTEDDGWTVTTADGKLSAQFEHTVAVTANGVRVLTLRPDEARRAG